MRTTPVESRRPPEASAGPRPRGPAAGPPGQWAALVASLLLAGACAHAPARVDAALPAIAAFAHVADSVVATAPLDRAHLGILVYEPATGRTLYEHNAERRFVPASNQKLWVTATALHELGPEYRYRTPVLGIGFDVAAGTVDALVVVGRGDPTMSARFHGSDHAVIDALADSVVAAGVRRVRGPLVVDASWFDAAVIPGSWTYGNLNSTSAPPVGAFAVAEGLFRLTFQPGDVPGASAGVVATAPPGVEPVRSGVVTAAAGTPRRTSVARGPWSDTLHVSGEIGVDVEPQTIRLPKTDPVRFAAELLAEALRARGVAIDGDVRVVYDRAEAAALREGRVGNAVSDASPAIEIAAWTSPPMGEVVAAILGPSQNWMTEMLVKTLGAERRGDGSWRGGIAVQTDFLTRVAGIDSSAIRLMDGSGMSHQNLVAPRAVVQLYDHARTAPWGALFRDALAKPAEPGTLSNRLRALEGRMEGKTGTLNSVNALSGYLRTEDGRELIFCIFSNASALPAAPVVAAIDLLVMTLSY
jgi:serine-type D-Ala-D-Ala carboxypeptidase/endopeptidase (penicillin-binding protein 4)